MNFHLSHLFHSSRLVVPTLATMLIAGPVAGSIVGSIAVLHADDAPVAGETLQDITHRLPLGELRQGLEKANEQLRNGLAGADNLQEQLQDLRGQLASSEAGADVQADQSFARIDAGLAARHQALSGAISQIDQTQDLLPYDSRRGRCLP